MQMMGYIMAWGSFSFASTFHYLIIVIMQTYIYTAQILQLFAMVYSSVVMVTHPNNKTKG